MTKVSLAPWLPSSPLFVQHMHAPVIFLKCILLIFGGVVNLVIFRVALLQCEGLGRV